MATCRLRTVDFFLAFAAVLTLFTSGAFSADYPKSVRLQLVHRHRPHSTPQLDRLRRLVRSDTARLRGISEKLRAANAARRRAQEKDTSSSVAFPACTNSTGGRRNASAEMGISSAADDGVAQYLVQLRVGSGEKKVTLIADTGSDLTWMSCRYKCRRGGCRRDKMKRRVYRADRSSTFRTVPCSSSACKDGLSNLFSLSRCASPVDPCAYDYRLAGSNKSDLRNDHTTLLVIARVTYSDGSAAQGVFGNDSITFDLTNGERTKLNNVLVGCSESFSGQSFQAAEGVMGLGYSNYSLAVTAATRFGGKFSYCLVDHLSSKNVSSYLVFGSHQHANISFRRMRHTELILGVISPFYFVNVKGISIGGSMLDIPAETWDVRGVGGTIVDSGSSLTGLTRPAYGPVMDALKGALKGFRKLDLDIGPVEFCFNSTGFVETSVPRLAVHFADGARLVPPVRSYVIDAAPGVKCLGFVPVPWPGSCVIGNIMQQKHLWEFDLANARLGFATSSCI